MIEGAKASTKTPMNFVDAIPTNTEEPISPRALLALASLVPGCFRKFMPTWLQNSTPKPNEVIRFTTKMALY